jgi:hypothetical protein
MNEFDADEKFDHDFDEDFDELQPCLGNDDSDDDYSLESLSSQEQFYEQWAGEKFLLRVYLHRCCRFLLSRFRPVKPADNTSDDELPF